MDYEIITTLGPGSDDVQMWRKLLRAGATGFRLNTSHMGPGDLDRWIARLGMFFDSDGTRVPVVLDLQGSKWRLGRIAPTTLEEGQTVTFELVGAASDPLVLPVPHEDFFRAVSASTGRIAVNDARVHLSAIESHGTRIVARVTRGGPVAAAKGVTVPGTEYRVEELSAKDRGIVSRTQLDPDVRYAISYVRDAVEMERYRALIGPGRHLIAKIERPEAIESVHAIALLSDAIWLCRGDLGAELGITDMARAVRSFHALVPALGVPVVMAGQVLEHMTGSPLPTRSEMCHLYDLIEAGYSGFVLSDETAVGSYPEQSCAAAAAFRHGT